MKRTPLKRKTPLQARADEEFARDEHAAAVRTVNALAKRSAKRSAKRPRKPKAGDDPKRLAWVRTLPCARCHEIAGSIASDGAIEAHHPTGAGMGLKAPDSEAFPLCFWCHRELHALNGNFADWSGQDLREWQAAQSAAYRVLWRVEQRADDRRGGGR